MRINVGFDEDSLYKEVLEFAESRHLTFSAAIKFLVLEALEKRRGKKPVDADPFTQ
jgi:hypothetical protein